MRFLVPALATACAAIAVASGQPAPAPEPDSPKETAPSASHPDLHAKLLELRQRDQAARKKMLDLVATAERNEDGSLKAGPGVLAVIMEVQAIDAESTAFLKQTVDRAGWPSVDMVGEDGAHAAWLLVQHADKDPAFQQRVLELMTPMVAEGQVLAADYAHLVDRVRVNSGEPQLYGTQFKNDGEGVLRPSPIEDAERVDERRAEVGLPPLAEYAEAMAESYDQPISIEPMPIDD